MAAKRDKRDRNQAPGQALLRAADHDRQQVVDLLKLALDEGRLTLPEYDERIRDVYAARTYAELHTLLADLPPAAGQVVVDDHRRPLPMALMVLWTIWGGLTALNIAIWLILTVTVGGIYPWPIWVAGPAGAALLATTVGVQAIRRSHRQED